MVYRDPPLIPLLSTSKSLCVCCVGEGTHFSGLKGNPKDKTKPFWLVPYCDARNMGLGFTTSGTRSTVIYWFQPGTGGTRA